MEQITIAGEVFNAPLRYSEGHVLTSDEARALNQTMHGNLRNTFTKVVKSVKDNGAAVDMPTLQGQFDKLASEYTFGRRRSSRTRDPVMAEALNIAKSKLKVKLLAKGINPNEVEPVAFTERAQRYIEKYPETLEQARQRIEEAKSVASADLDDDLLTDLPMKAAS